MRVGIGYDVHKLVENRKLILCGIEIPYEKGLLGHSDADCAVHALIDAMLGAAALGDIGKYFPDKEEKYSGISSMILLDETCNILKNYGYVVNNADITIIAQAPKLLPYIDSMRCKIAQHLNKKVSDISIKATTTEGLGFEGRKEGIACLSVVTIDKIHEDRR